MSSGLPRSFGRYGTTTCRLCFASMSTPNLALRRPGCCSAATSRRSRLHAWPRCMIAGRSTCDAMFWSSRITGASVRRWSATSNARIRGSSCSRPPRGDSDRTALRRACRPKCGDSSHAEMEPSRCGAVRMARSSRPFSMGRCPIRCVRQEERPQECGRVGSVPGALARSVRASRPARNRRNH